MGRTDLTHAAAHPRLAWRFCPARPAARARARRRAGASNGHPGRALGVPKRHDHAPPLDPARLAGAFAGAPVGHRPGRDPARPGRVSGQLFHVAARDATPGAGGEAPAESPDGTEYVVGAPHAFARDRLARALRPAIERALARCLQRPAVRVRFAVAGARPPAPPEATAAPAPPVADAPPSAIPDAGAGSGAARSTRGPRSSATSPGGGASSPSPPPGPWRRTRPWPTTPSTSTASPGRGRPTSCTPSATASCSAAPGPPCSIAPWPTAAPSFPPRRAWPCSCWTTPRGRRDRQDQRGRRTARRPARRPGPPSRPSSPRCRRRAPRWWSPATGPPGS